MKTLSLFILLILSSQALYAGDVHSTVTYVRVDQGGRGIIAFDEPIYNSPPSCASNHPRHFAFDARTDGGKAIMSLGLTAFASGKKIWARGTAECSGYGSVENWSWGYVKQD